MKKAITFRNLFKTALRSFFSFGLLLTAVFYLGVLFFKVWYAFEERQKERTASQELGSQKGGMLYSMLQSGWSRFKPLSDLWRRQQLS